MDDHPHYDPYDEYLSEVGGTDDWLKESVVQVFALFAALELELSTFIGIAWLRQDRLEESLEQLVEPLNIARKMDIAKGLLRAHHVQLPDAIVLTIRGAFRRSGFEVVTDLPEPDQLIQRFAPLRKLRNRLAHELRSLDPFTGEAVLGKEGDDALSIEDLDQSVKALAATAKAIALYRIAEELKRLPASERVLEVRYPVAAFGAVDGPNRGFDRCYALWKADFDAGALPEPAASGYEPVQDDF